MKKILLSLGCGAFVAFFFIFSLSSCHDEEVENVSELAYRHAYEDNFVKQYGEINPNQTWDFSSYAKRYKLNGALTRATMEDEYKSIASLSDDGYYHVPYDMTTFITDKFPERQDNSGDAHRFVLKADEACTFEIAYVYQGKSEPNFKLYCVIWGPTETGGSVETKELFSKGQVEVSTDGTNYSVLGTDWVVTSGSSRRDAPSTAGYSYVRSTPIRIDAPANSFIYFYIEITDPCTSDNAVPTTDSQKFGWIGDKLASIDNPHTIGLVDIATPQNIKAVDSNYEAYLLAIDDFCITCHNKGYVTDNSLDRQDFNDVMFLIAGNVPTPSTIDPGKIKTTIEKRYMIEDLYGYDYDFNDIVVDATQITSTPYEYTHPSPSNPEAGFVVHYDQATFTQSATMAHLCGTLPFQITVGNTSFNRVTDPTDEDQTMKQLEGESTSNTLTPAGTSVPGWEPNYTLDEIEGWDPKTNNISATIWTKNDSYTGNTLWPGEWKGAWTSEFPAAGDVPYIIAVDTKIKWMQEEVSIPNDWIGGDMTGMDISNN